MAAFPRPHARHTQRAIGILIGLAIAGCSGSRIYRPNNMPAECLVPKVQNAQTIDLSKLQNYSVSSELIDKGDVLEVTISSGYGSEKADTAPVRVAEDGTVNIALVGPVPVGGLELQAAEQAITAAGVQRGVFRSPNVTVTMKRQRMHKVTVIGAVNKPGVYELPRGASGLLAALVAAGGLAKEAGTEVEIRRPAVRGSTAGPSLSAAAAPNRAQLANFSEPQPGPGEASSIRINLVTAAQEGHGGYFLNDGDVVSVEKRDRKPIHVMGLVTKPGEYELPVNQDMHVLDSIAMAGGVTLQIADKVHLIRNLPGRDDPVVIEISITEAKREGKGNLRLGPGDIVSVEQTASTVVLDALKTFIRFGVSGTVPLF